jgi:hypothetical protein
MRQAVSCITDISAFASSWKSEPRLLHMYKPLGLLGIKRERRSSFSVMSDYHTISDWPGAQVPRLLGVLLLRFEAKALLFLVAGASLPGAVSLKMLDDM